jgi:hypothetical protein
LIYIDPNTLNREPGEAGRVDSAETQGDTLCLTGVINAPFATQYDIDRVVLLDGADRFIAASVVTDNKWTADIVPRDIGSDNGFLKLNPWACCDRTRRAFPLEVAPTVLAAYENFVRALLPEGSRDLPSISEDLRALIIKATRTPYIARSIRDNIATGNNYQSFKLGEAAHKGGRPHRERFMSQIDFTGCSVLDIGANIGENSRSARRLGAALVDGYEYDPYFVEIGRLINAAAGTTRVSLFQGDCTRPELFEGMKYDIVMAFSVWVYIRDTIRQIAGITDFLLFETHTLGVGMKYYYDRLVPHFPHAISLGYVEKPTDPTQSRMFVLLGKNKDALDAAVRRRFLKVESYFPSLAQFIQKSRPSKREEVMRLAQRCFEMHSAHRTVSEVELQFGTDLYFEVFLGGLHQFHAAGGKVGPDNIHLVFLEKGIRAGNIDPMLKPIIDNPDWLRLKVVNRYEDAMNIIAGYADRVAPVLLRTGDEEPGLSFRLTDGESVKGVLDGHHRLLVALLCGVEKFHVVLTNGIHKPAFAATRHKRD